MYVTAIHQITDPEKFRQAVQAATPPVSEFPAGIVLHSTFSNVDAPRPSAFGRRRPWRRCGISSTRPSVSSAGTSTSR